MTNDERLDTGAQGTAGFSDPALETVGAIHRPPDMAVDGGDAETVLTRFVQAGIDIDLAKRLQRDGAEAFAQ